MNPAAATMLGVDARRSIGKLVGPVVVHLRTDGAPVADADSQITAPLRDGTARQASDQNFTRADGSYFPVDYVSTPMIEREQLTGVVVSFKDITERHRSEAALQRSHRQLEATLPS